MKIYISGPITGTSDYQERFSAAEQIINANGGGDIVAVNPVKETAGIPEGSPWETYMKACMKILADCDAIYMLEGWTGSRGARLEYLVAMELGLREVKG